MRSASSGVCGVLAALLLPLALVSVWLHTVVADTGEYLARVDPLAAEARVRDAVQELLVEEVLHRVDLTGLGESLRAASDAGELDLRFTVPDLPGDLDERLQQLYGELEPLAEEARSDPAGAAAELVRRMAAAVVGSDAFAALWRVAQKAGHTEVVSVLSSPDPVRGGTQVVVPLRAFVTVVRDQLGAVRDQLGGMGPQLENTLDGLSVALPLGSARDRQAARLAYRVLEPLWLLLPVATAMLALVSVGLARRRLRTVVVLGGLAALLCVGLLAAVGVGKGLLLDRAPSESVRVVTDRIVDALSVDLRDAAMTGVLVGAALLVAAVVLHVVRRAARRTVAG